MIEPNGISVPSKQPQFEPLPGNCDNIDDVAHKHVLSEDGVRQVNDGALRVNVADHFNRLELLVKKWMPKIVLHNVVRVGASVFVVALLALSTYQVTLQKNILSY